MTSICKWTAGLALLAALALAAGCGEKDKDKKDDKVAKDGKDKKDKDKGEEGHEVGPNKGAIAEWGNEELHAEFTVDPKTKTAKVYVHGPDAKNWKAAPIKTDKVTLTMKKPSSFVVELKPEKQKDDPEGTASVFVGTHDNLAKDEAYEGVLSAKVPGKEPYSGDFKVKKDKK